MINKIIAVYFILISITCLQAQAAPSPTRDSRVAFDHYMIHSVPTADGINLQVLELLGQDGKPMTNAPVEILQHGYGNNFNIWAQVAPLERAKGKRILIPNTRGHGQGQTRSIGLDGRAPESDSRMVFDNLATLDVPAILDFAYELAGKKKVSWVGHSMGGMTMLLALGGVSKNERGNIVVSADRKKWVEDRLASFTAIGSPVYFSKTSIAERFSASLSDLVPIELDPSQRPGFGLPPVEAYESLSLSYLYYSQKALGALNPTNGVLNIKNISLSGYKFLMNYTLSDVPEFLKASIDFGNPGRSYSSSDGNVDYEKICIGKPTDANLPQKVPVTIISGDSDSFAILKYQKLMAQNRGFRQVIVKDAGHMDLVIGKHADTLSLELGSSKTQIENQNDQKFIQSFKSREALSCKRVVSK